MSPPTSFPAGLTVRARGSRFQVLAASPATSASGTTLQRLHLRGLEEPWRGTEITVLHPLEPVEPDSVPQLDLARPGRLARFHLLMDALRLELAPAKDRLTAPGRSRVRFEPYQQVPALRALELPRPRLLLADDVGLGKTIEAGLILRELNARRRAGRILIVCPAGIVDQWQEEMAGKFGFDFRIFDREGVNEARRALEAGTNPWTVEPRVLASMDYLKRREGAFRELAASRWDVIVVDEAHHLAAGDDEEVTDRHRLARWLAEENSGALILLTATPHDGYDETFASLLGLLEPTLVIPGRELRYDQYRRHLVRRLKRHIRLPGGRPKFVERLPVEAVPVVLPADSPEAAVQAAVRADVDALEDAARRARRAERGAIRFVATILRKRAASSLAALRSTVADRRKNIETRVAEVELRREHLRALRRGETIPDDALRRLERDLHRGYLQALQRSGGELRRLDAEERALADLQLLLDRCGTGPDAKLLALQAWLDRITGEDPQRKAIVFSEYADTVHAVARHLEDNGYAGQVVTLTGGEETTRAKRREALVRFAGPAARILVATDAAGEGLNLHERCHHLIHVELPWNPNRLEQRNGRIDRYGQTSPPRIAFLYAAGTYEGEVLKRLVLKIEQQIRRLGSVGDVLGQIQADRIEELLSRPAPDLAKAVVEAEAQIDEQLGRAADPRVQGMLGDGGQDEGEVRRALGAGDRDREEGVALDRFVERAVRAAGGEVVRGEGGLRVHTPEEWRAAELPESWETGDGSGDEPLHEDHPLVRAAVHWVRASRFRKDDDHRLAYVVVPDLAEPDLVCLFLVTLRDGAGDEMQRIEEVRVGRDLKGSQDATGDRTAARSDFPGNVPPERLVEWFGPWWDEARRVAKAEAERRAHAWERGVTGLRTLETQGLRAEVERWDTATQSAILGPVERELHQPDLFGGPPRMPPAVRRRLAEHSGRARERREFLERRLRIEEPALEPLGVLLRIPGSLVTEQG